MARPAHTLDLAAQQARLPILPDRAIAADSVPWVPMSEGVDFKPLRFDFANGVWTNVLRVQPGAVLARHRHSGGPVTGYCVEGSWRYLERDWVAVPGTLIYEPPGDIHTLVAGPEGMSTLFVTAGVLQFFDADEQITDEATVFTRYQQYVDHCSALGVEPIDLVF